MSPTSFSPFPFLSVVINVFVTSTADSLSRSVFVGSSSAAVVGSSLTVVTVPVIPEGVVKIPVTLATLETKSPPSIAA